MFNLSDPDTYFKNFLKSEFEISYWIKRSKKEYLIDQKEIYLPIYCRSEDCIHRTKTTHQYIESCESCVNRSKEDSPYFEKFSKVVKKRGYMRYPEFYGISRWKTTRQTGNYLKNPAEEIELSTKKVMDESLSFSKKIVMLKKLKGVGVPVASAILTAIFPERYCIFDFRVWHAFLWLAKCVDSSILKNYENFANFLENANKSTQLKNFLFFYDVISKVAVHYENTPRQLEMALWKYDKEKGIK